MKHKGSDLHLKVGLPPCMRLGGVLRQMQMPPLTTADMERLMFPLLTPRQMKILEDEGGVDFAHIVFDGELETRFRVNLFRARGRLSLVARRVNNSIPNFEGLGLPPVMAEITQYEQGIIILAGVTGSGKSTTIASMLQYINERERMHIVTIEDPIEFTFTDDKSIINQRELGIDVMDFHKALKDAVRQDPDIILVGEMRDAGHLRRRHPRRRDRAPRVRHHPRLDRPVDDQPHPRPLPPRDARAAPAEPGVQPQGGRRPEAAADDQGARRQGAARGCRPTRSCGSNPIIRKLILNEEDNKLGDAIRIGKEEGMQDFTESLRQLVQAEKIERATAFEYAPNVEQLKMALKGINVAQPGIL